MAKRIFFCAERKFPRGDAGGNRILYIARAMIILGYEVLVISVGENRKQDYDKNKEIYIYKGIPYINIYVRNGLYNRYDSRIISGNKTIKILEKYKFNRNDIAVIYTSNAIYGMKLINFTLKKVGAKVIMDVVEWFQPFQYKFGALNPKYLLYKYCFNRVYPKTKNVIAISKLLKDHFSKKDCNVFRLPILTDTNDYEFKQKKSYRKIKFIYPGYPGKKDAFDIILKAIDLLTLKEKNKIEFHVTGTTKRKLIKVLKKEAYLLEKLKDVVIIHGWLSYKDLMDIYSDMNFLLLARHDNIVTNANFPSKIPELLACGIAPVVNCVGDFYEYLKDGYDSILYESCTPESCKESIQRILTMDKQKLKEIGENSCKTARNTFNFTLWVDKIQNYLNEVIHAKNEVAK